MDDNVSNAYYIYLVRVLRGGFVCVISFNKIGTLEFGLSISKENKNSIHLSLNVILMISPINVALWGMMLPSTLNSFGDSKLKMMKVIDKDHYINSF